MNTETLLKKDPYSALRFKDFRFFLTTKILLTMALQIQAVVVGWQVYELTKDPLSLGLIGLAEILPNFSVTLFAGHFADIYNRKKIVLTCLFVLMCSSFSLYLTSSTPHSYQLLSIYFLIGISGFARGTLGPSMFSIMTECVPKEHYFNSTTWHSTLWQIAFMIGAGASGFVFNSIREKSYLFITLFVSCAFVAFLFISPKPQKHTSDRGPIFASIKSGIKFVFSNHIFLGALSLDLFAVLFGGAVALLPIFANEILMV
ncbi:MAG: MFS transporter, partial [Bacteriovoracaceae bacterium]|nr:MFS transporter [Bacteriovoracaceae bacterium]